jgi:hypothetical protein
VKPSPQEFKKIRNLALTVDGNPEFSHIAAITKESIGLILIFGIPAAILDAVIRKDIDEKTAESIKPKEIESNYRAMFISSLVENFQDLKRFDSVRVIENSHNQSKNNFDGIVNLEIINWGSRIKKSGSDRIVLFMDIQISMIRTFDKKLVWSENQTVISDTSHTLENYKQQQGLLQSDFTALINKAGKRVATLLRNP